MWKKEKCTHCVVYRMKEEQEPRHLNFTNFDSARQFALMMRQVKKDCEYCTIVEI